MFVPPFEQAGLAQGHILVSSTEFGPSQHELVPAEAVQGGKGDGEVAGGCSKSREGAFWFGRGQTGRWIRPRKGWNQLLQHMPSPNYYSQPVGFTGTAQIYCSEFPGTDPSCPIGVACMDPYPWGKGKIRLPLVPGQV